MNRPRDSIIVRQRVAIFGRAKRSAAQQLLAGEWSSDDERRSLVEALQQERSIKPIEALKLFLHNDRSVSTIGLSHFNARPDAKAVQLIFEALISQPSQQRSFALAKMGQLPTAAIEPAIAAMTSAHDQAKKRIGFEAAIEVRGESRLRHLELVVRHARGPMRSIALRALIEEGSADHNQELLFALTEDDDARMRSTAIEMISKIHTLDVFEKMMQWMLSGTMEARDLAATYIRQYAATDPEIVRDRMMEMLASGNDGARRLAAELLLSTGDPRVVLVDIFKFLRGLMGWLRERILATLKTLGDTVLRPAVDLLQHPDEEVRTAALVLAEEFNDPRLVGPVCGLLTANDWWLRVVACDYLGKLKDERAVPHLVKALEDTDTRWAALDALAQIGSPSALQPIAAMSKDERKEVRSEVVAALGRFDDPRMIRFLQRVAETDPVLEVRTRAAETANSLARRLRVSDEVHEAKTTLYRLENLDKPIDRFLARIREQGASDLHLCVDEPPFVRNNGELQRLEMNALNAQQIADITASVLTPEQHVAFERTGDVDFCYEVTEVGRYRANIYQKRCGVGLSFRVIPNIPPTFSRLRLPDQLTEIQTYHQGIVLITGPAGSGKSTTLAALVNLINDTKPCHIITLESPIEFVHPTKIALVNQREVGKHTESYARALKGALRQDPDVVVVGELRDLLTTRMSLIAAETGHLVIATMPTNSAIATLDRLIEMFPPDEQEVIRMSLSDSLKYVISQKLVRKSDGQGRVAVFEILKNNLAVSGLLRENKTHQIATAMQVGLSKGMQTQDMALQELVNQKLIQPEAAYLQADKPELFEPLCSPEFLQSGVF